MLSYIAVVVSIASTAAPSCPCWPPPRASTPLTARHLCCSLLSLRFCCRALCSAITIGVVPATVLRFFSAMPFVPFLTCLVACLFGVASSCVHNACLTAYAPWRSTQCSICHLLQVLQLKQPCLSHNVLLPLRI